jgi:hypothetical protein
VASGPSEIYYKVLIMKKIASLGRIKYACWLDSDATILPQRNKQNVHNKYLEKAGGPSCKQYHTTLPPCRFCHGFTTWQLRHMRMAWGTFFMILLIYLYFRLGAPWCRAWRLARACVLDLHVEVNWHVIVEPTFELLGINIIFPADYI